MSFFAVTGLVLGLVAASNIPDSDFMVFAGCALFGCLAGVIVGQVEPRRVCRRTALLFRLLPHDQINVRV